MIYDLNFLRILYISKHYVMSSVYIKDYFEKIIGVNATKHALFYFIYMHWTTLLQEKKFGLTLDFAILEVFDINSKQADFLDFKIQKMLDHFKNCNARWCPDYIAFSDSVDEQNIFEHFGERLHERP